jgi:hypothetical protein
MSTLRLLAAVLIGSAALSACCCCPTASGRFTSARASGIVVTKSFDLPDFDRLVVSHAFRVNVKHAEARDVQVRIDEEFLRYLEVLVDGGTLNIGLKPDRAYTFDNATLEASVTMPTLRKLHASGASRVTLEGCRSGLSFELQASGASHVQGGRSFGVSRLNVSGASRVTLSGSAGDLFVDASGASRVDLSGLQVPRAKVDASGASQVTVKVSGELDADASGGARVRYVGYPRPLIIDESGGGSVKRR